MQVKCKRRSLLTLTIPTMLMPTKRHLLSQWILSASNPLSPPTLSLFTHSLITSHPTVSCKRRSKPSHQSQHSALLYFSFFSCGIFIDLSSSTDAKSTASLVLVCHHKRLYAYMGRKGGSSWLTAVKRAFRSPTKEVNHEKARNCRRKEDHNRNQTPPPSEDQDDEKVLHFSF